MTRDPHCIFCKIVAGEIPSAQVLATPQVVAFLDINPVAPGHLLVVPRTHAGRLSEIEPSDWAAVAGQLPRLAAALLKATGAPACNLIVNDGKEAGQVIPHVHVHVIPRTATDGLDPHWPHGRCPAEQLDAMRRRLVDALGGCPPAGS